MGRIHRVHRDSTEERGGRVEDEMDVMDIVKYDIHTEVCALFV